MKKLMNKIVWGIIPLLVLGMSPLGGAEKKNNTEAQKQVELIADWQEFHSVSGKCKMKFPNYPQHVTENMKFEEGYNLRYDAYVSSVKKEEVYMLLIAQYPDFVDQSYAKMSLEGFLNGILTHNPNNQLLFADLILVEGYEGMDFFIRTGSVYFKGRAVMIKNSLYLMAMECDMTVYNENQFNQFIGSFKLAK